MDDKVFQLIKDRLDALDMKVDKLLAFKWQIIGGSIVLSIFFTMLIQVLSIYFTKGS